MHKHGKTSKGNQRYSVSSWIKTALLTVALIVPVPVQPARADANGCSIYSNAAGIPTNWICIEVWGEGTYIHNMYARWRGPSQCNWRIDWVIYYKGRTWWRDNGPEHNVCNHGQGGRTRGKGHAPAGSDLCAELYDTAKNSKIDAACVAIEN